MNPDTVSRTIQRRGTRLCGVGLLALLVLASPLWAQRGHDGRGFEHVFVIMMENTGYDTLIGNPNAPFINFAASTTGLASNYFGVAHPSQPNYVAATSGALNGVLDDNDITIDVPNIVDQLEGRHKTWKAYMQSYSLCTTPLDHACGTSSTSANTIRLFPTKTYRPIRHGWQTSWTSASSGLTSPTIQSRTMSGSVLTSATTCTGGARPRTIHAIFHKCRR